METDEQQLRTGSILPLWDLGEIPFHVGFRPQPTNEPFADQLPFRLGADQASGRVAQLPDEELRQQLELAYRRGSQIGTPMSDQGFGLSVRDEFAEFLGRAIEGRDWEGLRVLEIGCGKGFLSRHLSSLGAEVTGIDPGAPESVVGGPVMIQCEFSADLVDGEFDVIIHYGVLEHVVEPLAFLAEQLDLLAPDGVLTFAVPDCEAPLASGDISILVHQHWSYFEPRTLERMASSLSLVAAEPERGRHAGALYCAWRRSTNGQRPDPPADVAQTFVDRAREGVARTTDFCGELAEQGAELGLFPGNRFMNFAALADELPVLRLFDDDTRLHGQYYPPLEQPVESREELLSRPPDVLVITSRTFLDKLRQGLGARPELSRCRILGLDEILHGEAQS